MSEPRSDHHAPPRHAVTQLRLVVEAPDFDDAVRFYRDVLGLPERMAFEGDGDARVAILDAGRATLELANPAQKRMIDAVEAGGHVSERLRVAFEVDDTEAVTDALRGAGAEVVAPPTVTPWRSLNARLAAPASLQVTLFQELRDAPAGPSVEIPPELHPLLESTAIALVSTIGPAGQPQTTPIWFLWRDGAVRFSLVDGRQKLRNLRRDPRASVVIIDPAEPTRYLELRGRVGLDLDPDLSLERAVAVKYRGEHVDVEPPGTLRYAATLVPERVTSQSGH